jgi:hypothetical protein
VRTAQDAPTLRQRLLDSPEPTLPSDHPGAAHRVRRA